MIPGNTFTPTPIVGTFLYLQSLPYNPLSQTVMGGVALQDGSQGRLVKPWTVFYLNGLIQVRPENNAVVFTLPATDVQTVSLAFDANMSLVIAWQTSTDANIYYYDTITASYITRNFPGVISCRVCVDDPLEFYTAQSDVIFGYTLSGNLNYRQQRDRYDIEYLIKPTSKYLIKMGPSSVNRLQFELFG
jgi:hypothetical protein